MSVRGLGRIRCGGRRVSSDAPVLDAPDRRGSRRAPKALSERRSFVYSQSGLEPKRPAADGDSRAPAIRGRRSPRPRAGVPGLQEARRVQAAAPLPVFAWQVAVDLDPVPFGIVEIERFTDAMVRCAIKSDTALRGVDQPCAKVSF